ncbi:MAG: type II toxin-antitoxin system VapC family toxin [Gammaproteobacteria bacterium]|nr:type II toxin-antitoxin system VapC family toxin [Gammaproteobacteria bacterium]
MVVLDTHTWIWWVNQSPELSRKAGQGIRKAMTAEAVYISSISAWEVAMLVTQKRLALTMEVRDWIRACAALPFVHFVPVNNDIVVTAVHLPEGLHKDPADRMIAATANFLDMPLVTRDRRLLEYPGVRAFW